MEETRANFRNQEAAVRNLETQVFGAVRNLETQVGQIARQLSTTLPNAFPSDTQVNPKVCKAVTLRSGRDLEEDKVKDLNKRDEEELNGKSTKEAQKSEGKPTEKSTVHHPTHIREDPRICVGNQLQQQTIPFPQQLKKE
ncbi:hypothetical protein PIB30_113390, partial [Stylosanthes scabra]|nr:hypothetical protein [Stylosanthes scabra]